MSLKMNYSTQLISSGDNSCFIRRWHEETQLDYQLPFLSFKHYIHSKNEYKFDNYSLLRLEDWNNIFFFVDLSICFCFLTKNVRKISRAWQLIFISFQQLITF